MPGLWEWREFWYRKGRGPAETADRESTTVGWVNISFTALGREPFRVGNRQGLRALVAINWAADTGAGTEDSEVRAARLG